MSGAEIDKRGDSILARLRRDNPGLELGRIVTTAITEIKDPDEMRQFAEELAEEIRALPGPDIDIDEARSQVRSQINYRAQNISGTLGNEIRDSWDNALGSE